MNMRMKIKSLALRVAKWPVALSLLALTAGAALSQTISDVPLAVKNNVPPNMMFMIDNSGSMSNIVPTAPYNATATYPITCAANRTIASGASIDINIGTVGGVSGVPRFTYSGNTYRHITLDSTNGRCFDNNGIYAARLLGEPNSPSSYLDADYTGHFLNWYFGNFDGPVSGWSGRKRLTVGSVDTRMEIAKTSAKTVVDGLPINTTGSGRATVRIGLSTYNSGNGGRLLSTMKDLVDPINTSTSTTIGKTTFKTSIDGLTPSGATPLATTLADIGRYFSTGYDGNVITANGTVSINNLLRLNGTDDNRAACLAGWNSCSSAASDPRPIQYTCQRSYAFLMTDGRPQGDRSFNNNTYLHDYDRDCSGANASACTGSYDRKTARQYESQGSDYLDDVAKALFDIDLRPDLTVTPPRIKKNNLLTYTIGFADTQVRNDPLLINAAAQGGGRFLTADDGPSLTSAFQSALTDAFAKDAASAAVAVANAQITVNNISYAPSYNSGSWYGDLEAFSLDTTTGLPIGAAHWSARDRLNALALANRKIASFNGSTGQPFTGANFAGTPASLTVGVIDYVRGVRTGEGTTYRTRAHLLGDLVNAEPTVVTYGDGVPIVFQAANDGMLHAFDGRVAASATTRGQELWAYVPRLVHPNLAALSTPNYAHRYYVDGTPATAAITGAGAMTRILVGGLGKGGAGYYALDISDYAAATEADVAAKAKWEIKPTNMGYSFGTPLIVNTSAGWRVVVASGYDNGAALGGDGQGYVWVLNPSTGAVEKTIRTGVGSAASPSGLAHLSRLANTPADAVVRYVFGGDLAGNVWRIDLDAADNSLAARIAVLTDGAGNTQAVTAPVQVGPVSGSSVKYFVYAGTGRYLADEDVPGNAGVNRWATQMQTMYGILDDTSVASPTTPNIRGSNGSTCPAGGGSADFVCQSFTHDAGTNSYSATAHPVDVASKRGWYIDMPNDTRLQYGRMTTTPALTTGGTLAFTVNVPTNVACDPGGSSWFFALSGSNGGAVPRVIGGNTYFVAGIFLGDALASRPVILETADGKHALIQKSDKSRISPPIPEPTSVAAQWRRIYWRALH